MRDRAPALRLYRGLLWLYPAEFRDHFAGEMCRALADCLRQRPDPIKVLWLYLGVLIDAPKERYHMIRQDVVYALRTMRREKLSSLVAMLVLALGIGSTATVFTLVNGMLLKPLPYPDQNRIVYVEEVSRDIKGAVAYPNYRDFQDRNRTLEDIAMFGSGLATLRGDMEAERVPAGSGTEPLFRILGVQPLLGRTFTAEECRLGGPSTVLLSEDLWRRRYGGDPGIVGTTIGIGSDQARVVGVMPSGFHFPDVAELWMPLQLNPKNNTRMDHGLEGIALLRRGATVEQAQDDLRGIMRQIIQEHPTKNYGQTVNVSPYRVRDTQRVKPVLFTLMGAVAFVLLIACANITNLLLVKASARTREIAVRGALGASRARLVRQFMVESVLLGLAGAAGGIVLAWAAIPGLLALVPQHLPMWIQFTPDARVLGFVTAITAGTAILAGAVPACAMTFAELKPKPTEKEMLQLAEDAKEFFLSTGRPITEDEMLGTLQAIHVLRKTKKWGNRTGGNRRRRAGIIQLTGSHYRPWRYWRAMVAALEYGVEDKILPGSDFPSATMENVIAGLRKINCIVEGTNLPQIPVEVQDRILYENWKAFFPHWA